MPQHGELSAGALVKRMLVVVALMIGIKLVGDWLAPQPGTGLTTLVGIALIVLGCIVMIDWFRLFRKLANWLIPPPRDR
ncbi:MAG: hypothetical protein AAF409_17645 [Pseudomonadota bacterium]